MDGFKSYLPMLVGTVIAGVAAMIAFVVMIAFGGDLPGYIIVIVVPLIAVGAGLAAGLALKRRLSN